jgi:ATP-binding cassette subfamily G (WHITE) protein 2 (PDR)
VSGHSRDASFQRKIGYVQQQDLHLETSTVREALQFSALLRQPATVSRKEKYEYVQDIIKMLNMEDFAEAIVGVPGEGLNVHQRKLLTIGVELAAKPGLLLFLDEPTSGLDSQSSWSIISVLRKLADHGQPILSTIHQPSSTLFQEFDRLLLLGEGGKTVYFGDIGDNSETILRYFESHGARKCGPEDNVAEYALEVVGNPPPNMTLKNWHDLWNESEENKAVHMELEVFGKSGADNPLGLPRDIDGEFAMPLRDQITATTVRIFQQYWRTPSYIWGKILLGILSSLYVYVHHFKTRS